MKFHGSTFRAFLASFALALSLVCPGLSVFAEDAVGKDKSIDLLELYPTKLTAGDTENARQWEFSTADIFSLSHFDVTVGKDFHVETGPADLGIGHCADGAVWAVVIPRENGSLTWQSTNREDIAHVWLRFHPREITRLFPPTTVHANGATNLYSQIRRVANHKMISSWQAGGLAMIPEPKDMTVDVDTKNGPRRFFSVDTDAGKAQYWAAFQNEALKPPPTFNADAAQEAFDKLWSAFDERYAMFVLRPEVDWAKLRETYRPRALACKTTSEFAETCADMLKTLRDLHVWLTLAGEDVPVFNRPRTANSNPSAHKAILGSMHQEGHVEWAVTEDKIGFIAIYGWDNPDVPVQCQRALEQMRDTRGLIVDVRLNGGGSEDLAMEFAARFLKQEFVYAYSQYRNGSSHTNLTEKFPRKIAPHGPWRYDRPAVLLIGQKCMSSNESFVGMMTGDPDVTTMGDHTCGSSGNPEIIELPLEMTVSVPQWIDYLPDGTPLDERGFQPQILFKPEPGAFEGARDDLLTAALERLRKAPLPHKLIAGPAFATEEEAEERDESRPKVVSVFPADGAQSVEPVTELRVKFDRPMDPLSLKLNWQSGGVMDCGFPNYDADKHEFTIPVNLAEGMAQQITVNEPIRKRELAKSRADFPFDGFQSADHRLARLFSWRFKTSGSLKAKVEPPKVVKISPSPGSSVPYRTWVEVQFDQPMKTPAEVLPYLNQKYDTTEPMQQPALVCNVGYDSNSHTFRIPLLLFPGKQSEFTFNGFCSEAGVSAKPVRIQYQVSNEALSSEGRGRFDAAAKNPQLLSTLDSMRRELENTTSGVERVQEVSLYRFKDLFTRYESHSSSFKWQKPGQFVADGTQMMMMSSVFRIGSDGKNCWWQEEGAGETNFVVCPLNKIKPLNLSLCDPFDLAHLSNPQAASNMDLNYLGTTNFSGASCHVIEGWGWDKVAPGTMTPIGFHLEWLVDAQTSRVSSIKLSWDNTIQRTRFFYDSINQRLPEDVFAIPKANGLSSIAPQPLSEEYTNCFINIGDGSDGNMLMRYGLKGPKGRSEGGYINFN